MSRTPAKTLAFTLAAAEPPTKLETVVEMFISVTAYLWSARARHNMKCTKARVTYVVGPFSDSQCRHDSEKKKLECHTCV
jgi:hypothetical protein